MRGNTEVGPTQADKSTNPVMASMDYFCIADDPPGNHFQSGREGRCGDLEIMSVSLRRFAA